MNSAFSAQLASRIRGMSVLFSTEPIGRNRELEQHAARYKLAEFMFKLMSKSSKGPLWASPRPPNGK